MDRRRIEFQIKAVLVTYRVERRRRDGATLDAFRSRAASILDEIEPLARRHPDLEALLNETRDELADTRSFEVGSPVAEPKPSGVRD